jgi:hypothetical protein
MFVDIDGDAKGIDIAWFASNFLYRCWLFFWFSPEYLVEGKHAAGEYGPGHAVLTTDALKV